MFQTHYSYLNCSAAVTVGLKTRPSAWRSEPVTVHNTAQKTSVFSFTHTATKLGLNISQRGWGGRPGGAQLSIWRISWCSGSAACALAPVACVVDVEEGLGLPQVGPPLIHVGCWKLCVGACSQVTTNKSSMNEAGEGQA